MSVIHVLISDPCVHLVLYTHIFCTNSIALMVIKPHFVHSVVLVNEQFQIDDDFGVFVVVVVVLVSPISEKHRTKCEANTKCRSDDQEKNQLQPNNTALINNKQNITNKHSKKKEPNALGRN